MPINFYYEMPHIVNNLKRAEGNKGCEKVIVSNIRKHIEQDCKDPIIETYLKELSNHLERLIELNKGKTDSANYSYSQSYINTLLKMPFRRSWFETIKI